MTTYSSRLAEAFQPRRLEEFYVQILNTLMKEQQHAGVFDEPLPQGWEPKYENMSRTRLEFLNEQYKHEVAAFVSCWRESLPESLQPYGYLGLTSSNLIDTARSMAAKSTVRRITWFVNTKLLPALHQAETATSGWEREGRTHGQNAARVPQSRVYTRAIYRLDEGLSMIWDVPAGALQGPVGEANERVLPPRVLRNMSQDLEIPLDPYPTQIADRQHWSDWLYSLYRLLGTCEQLATHHRLESLSGIERFQEGFNVGVQRGSSSMPHKRNPIKSERICGLARVARGQLLSFLETATSSWWERDLTNSSVERVTVESFVNLVCFVLEETEEVLTKSEYSAPHGDLPEDVDTHNNMVNAQLAGLNPDKGVYYELQRGAKDV